MSALAEALVLTFTPGQGNSSQQAAHTMNANSFLQLSIVLTWGCNLLLALTALRIRINRMKRQREQLAPGIRGGIERDAS